MKEGPKALPATAPVEAAPPKAAPPPTDAALQLLALLQREGRFVDFLEEDVASFTDADIGAAARAMSNFGLPELRLVHAYDVAFREARSAVKSKYILEQAETCRHRYQHDAPAQG